MLEIGGGWLEKLVRFRLPNWDWQQGTGNREQGTGNREQGTGNREQEPVGMAISDQSQTNPNALKAFIINEIEGRWAKANPS
jgi:hypothetical protein